MYFFSQPCGNFVDPVFRNKFININILFHFMKELRTVSRTEGIAWEITQRTAAPMRILKAAHAVAGNIDSEIFLIQSVPFIRQILS